MSDEPSEAVSGDAASAPDPLAAVLGGDLRRLIVAARIVAFQTQSPEAISELAAASEAFADAVPWDDEPEPVA